jgi:hypothetical protein
MLTSKILVHMSRSSANTHLTGVYDSPTGFTHSAFSLRTEARLEQTPHYRTFVQRGALVDLLGKALLYSEVEAHWRADTVTSSCAHPFTLLTSHVCSADARTRPLPVAEKLQEALENEPAPSTGQQAQQTSTKGSAVADGKRKAADTTAENRTEKRVRTSSPMNGVEEGEPSKAGTTKGEFLMSRFIFILMCRRCSIFTFRKADAYSRNTQTSL